MDDADPFHANPVIFFTHTPRLPDFAVERGAAAFPVRAELSGRQAPAGFFQGLWGSSFGPQSGEHFVCRRIVRRIGKFIFVRQIGQTEQPVFGQADQMRSLVGACKVLFRRFAVFFAPVACDCLQQGVAFLLAHMPDTRISRKQGVIQP